MRTDLFFFQLDRFINLKFVKNQLLKKHQLNEKFIITPNYNHWGGVNDQIGIMSEDVVKVYLTLLLYFDQYCSKNVRFHQETQLKYHLDQNDIKYVGLESLYEGIKSDSKESRDAGGHEFPEGHVLKYCIRRHNGLCEDKRGNQYQSNYPSFHGE